LYHIQHPFLTDRKKNPRRELSGIRKKVNKYGDMYAMQLVALCQERDHDILEASLSWVAIESISASAFKRGLKQPPWAPPVSSQVIMFHHKNIANAIPELITPNTVDHTLTSTASPNPAFEEPEAEVVEGPESVDVDVTWRPAPAAPDVFPAGATFRDAEPEAGVVVLRPADPDTDADADAADEEGAAVGTSLPPVVAFAANEGAALTTAVLTREPTPHEMLSPSGWVLFGGGVVDPEEEDIANRVVHWGLLDSAGEMNW
jgi:hypothetical protein